MAEFKQVMANAKRMYSQSGYEYQTISIKNLDIDEFEIGVEAWAAKHPVKTNLMAIKEIYPKYNGTGACMLDLTGENPECGCDFIDCRNCEEQWLNSEYKGGADNG